MVSVIVPVYNTEKYLDKCIQSILLQTYKDFELILVDDGSTDDSKYVCLSYQKENDNINVVLKENGGQNSAIIEGLKQSRGESAIFIDSDDWVEPTIIEELVSLRKKYSCDCVVCRTCRDDEIDHPSQSSKGKVLFTYEEIKSELYPNLFCNLDAVETSVSNSRCAKLFNIELLKSIVPLFEKVDIKYGEDALMVKTYILKCKSIAFTDSVLYHYRRNMYSTTNSVKHVYEQEKKMIEQLRKNTQCLSDYNFSKQFGGMYINAKVREFESIAAAFRGTKLRCLLCNLLNDYEMENAVIPKQKSKYKAMVAKAIKRKHIFILQVLALRIRM